MANKTIRVFNPGSSTPQQDYVDVLYIDNGDGTYTPASNVVVQAGDIEIGSVELKDAATDTRVKIGAGTALVEGDNALATRDPKAVSTLASILAALSSLGGFVDGVEALLAGGLPASLGQKAKAASLPVVLASDQDALVMDAAATTPSLYTLTLTNADTEYSQALPATCRRVSFHCRTAADVRFAYATGKVAGPTDPYQTIKSGAFYDSGPIKLSSGVLYLASGSAGVKIEIEAWN